MNNHQCHTDYNFIALRKGKEFILNEFQAGFQVWNPKFKWNKLTGSIPQGEAPKVF